MGKYGGKNIVMSLVKRLFCKHTWFLNRWHVSHGPNGNDPSEIEAEYICLNCKKRIYRDYNINFRSYFESIVKEYDGRLSLKG